MVSVYEHAKDCCGCTACKNICPQKAIEMIPDEEGFLYPYIDQSRCIDCYLCKETCAFQHAYERKDSKEIFCAYGVKHKDNEIRLASRSGGMFTAVSDLVLLEGGVVYGVGYKNNLEVSHKKATNKSTRDEFRGSKYVQSNLDSIFKDIANELSSKSEVLFCGTPCQVDALKSYIQNSRIIETNLFTCDIICHGTPSPKLFRDYIKYLEKRYKGKITHFDFRDKKMFGWEAHKESFIVDGYAKHSSNIYTNLFYQPSTLRPACYNCKYTDLRRCSDITLADFWGVDNIIPDFNDNRGISLVLTNTQKGHLLFQKVQHDLLYIECTDEPFMKENHKTPVPIPKNRAQFWYDYTSKGFSYVVKKYSGHNLNAAMKRQLSNILKLLRLYDILLKLLKH